MCLCFNNVKLDVDKLLISARYSPSVLRPCLVHLSKVDRFPVMVEQAGDNWLEIC